ncbi:hypothetical protein B0187_08920 [Haemophilus paracuniculus]|uniref:Helicase/UvrB N-terminal domain-containing protein n=1 Tax=Haemophilus paracuniculus TaxID=734 RepID=A0A1T0AQ49_9PAST|nr:DEAD/DEAH box helicase family protein [Haemophilus paracuniculus]OOR98380.1 hypothetical protein B0187_08920 [Haemophilus paracuniculus]
MAKATKKTKANRTFHQELVLNKWIMSLFYKQDLSQFKALADLEGISATGQTKFYEALTEGLFNPNKISLEKLAYYDRQIIQHWQKITQKRNLQENRPLQLKYFQYLSLLFTEIYLDRYFNQQDQLLSELNQVLAEHCKDKDAPKFQPYTLEDLNKLAFWSATGRGKTLLMHINLLQYRHYWGQKNAKQDKQEKLAVYLLTPNEGLSAQHLAELGQSGIEMAFFDKNKGADLLGSVQIIDINKLGDKEGDKTVAVSSFEGDNKLVLIDEGHRGSSGEAWLNYRNALIGNGFSFEYSATFGQAVKDRKTVADFEKAEIKKKGELDWADKKALRQKSIFEVYAKAILFDYSYKYFYQDGYGKESLILNLDSEYAEQGDNEKKYFLAGLLSFYQQLYLFERDEKILRDQYLLSRPLWVFVGSKVNKEDSDVLVVLNYLAEFLNNPEQSKRWLGEILSGTAFLDKKGQPIFRDRFTALNEAWQDDAAGLYADILSKLFNCTSSQRLALVNLKKAAGEYGLRVGREAYFGVINVGEGEFFKNAKNETAFDCEEDTFGEGLFSKINNEKHRLQLLIGSRKFSEGWSSWRVSTMGLLNIGKNEGSQIIQLFGRGVRLKGKDFSLKRTSTNDPLTPKYLKQLETLNIFGVKASYMAQFREYLDIEKPNDENEMITLNFPTRPNLPSKIRLKTIRLKEGYRDNQQNGFKRQQTVSLYQVPEKYQGKFHPVLVELDLYPRLDSLSTTKQVKTQLDHRDQVKLNRKLFDYFDWDKIYLDLWQFKLNQTWWNWQIDSQKLREFVEQNNDWYCLYAPKEAMVVNDFSAVAKQQAILQELLERYTERFYLQMKACYEAEHLTAVEVQDDDRALLSQYQINIQADEAPACEAKINELKQHIGQGDLASALKWQPPFSAMRAILFDSHLYQPLFYLEKSNEMPLTMMPTALNEGEHRFVDDLMKAEKSGDLDKWIGGRALYLLRNPANKNKGLGFALAGNFYPDFLVWVVDHATGEQWLSFVDPKGIRHISLSDPKFGLPSTIKDLEQKLKKQAGDNQPALHLSSFILSVTDRNDLLNVELEQTESFTQKRILFMQDEHYLKTMFALMLGENR